jgi:hypothetical protein
VRAQALQATLRGAPSPATAEPSAAAESSAVAAPRIPAPAARQRAVSGLPPGFAVAGTTQYLGEARGAVD